jgi:hypothetical protein
MKKLLVLAIALLASNAFAGKDADPQPTTPTKTATLTQSEPVFGLMEKNLDRGSFKSLKDKVPAIFNTTNGPTCGCSGPHDCCISTVCVKSCR